MQAPISQDALPPRPAFHAATMKHEVYKQPTHFSFSSVFSWIGVRLRDGLRNNEPDAFSVSVDFQLSVLELAVEARSPPSFLVIVGSRSSSKEPYICYMKRYGSHGRLGGWRVLC